MTKLGPSRQVTKRRARDDIRAKMVLGVDLNTPPLEGHEQEASSGSGHPPVSQRTSVSITPRCNHPTGQQQGSLLSTNYGTNSLLIDVDAIEDEVQLLSSSRGFPQGRNCSRRNQPVTVVLDEDTDTHSRRSEGLVTMLSLDNHNKHERSSRNTAVINCEVYPDLEKEDNMKGKNVMESRPEPPKQLTFTCPICMNTLVEASSTICGHIFCQSCIKASIQFQKKCPTCRRKLTMNNFHRVYLPTTN